MGERSEGRFSVLNILALLVFLIGVSCSGDPEPDTKLKVMTFNVLCAFCSGDEYDPWNDRVRYFRDIFKRHAPDLIGLQELAFASDTEEVHRYNKEYETVYFDDGEDVYADSAIFYRSSRFSVVEKGFYWLSPTPDIKLSTGFSSGMQLPRLVAWVRFADAVADRELYFATTHFDNNSPSQDRSAPLLLDRTEPMAKQLPVIITGDFNSQIPDPAYRVLVGTSTRTGFHLANAFDVADDWSIDTNQSPVPEYDLDNRIDHLFVAGENVSWQVSHWTVDLHTYGEQNRYPSDHFAIAATVDF